jgi:hypothetical protein
MKFKQNKKRIDPRYFLNEDWEDFSLGQDIGDAASWVKKKYRKGTGRTEKEERQEKERIETGPHAKEQEQRRKQTQIATDPSGVFAPDPPTGVESEERAQSIPDEPAPPEKAEWQPDTYDQSGVFAPDEPLLSDKERSTRWKMNKGRAIAHASQGMPSCEGSADECREKLSAFGKTTDQIELGMTAVGAERPEDIPKQLAWEIALSFVPGMVLTKGMFGMLARKYGMNVAGKVVKFVNSPGASDAARRFGGSIPSAVESALDIPQGLSTTSGRSTRLGPIKDMSPGERKELSQRQKEFAQSVYGGMQESRQFRLTAPQLKYIIDEALRSI